FDLVFLDPPFAAGLDVAAAASALALLNQGGLLYLESDRSWAQALEQTSGSSREQLASCLRLIRQAKAGAVHYHLLQRHNDSGQATS
ncbi:MAG: 16S rRNA (guanine(966)-N(2))-methyltransferase RsmD, partial [Betaproteobacteria bacterium]|nr:16S rRNA (guanine(966)-N(2))-methyltransferase RsmD [Betaproteobacteria bacterium]